MMLANWNEADLTQIADTSASDPIFDGRVLQWAAAAKKALIAKSSEIPGSFQHLRSDRMRRRFADEESFFRTSLAPD